MCDRDNCVGFSSRVSPDKLTSFLSELMDVVLKHDSSCATKEGGPICTCEMESERSKLSRLLYAIEEFKY